MIRRLTTVGVAALTLSVAAWAQNQGLFLNINGNQVMGGSTLSGVVALPNPATGYGAVINLSAGPGISVPPTVTIPAGQTSAVFNIATFPSGNSQSVRITATYAGMQQSAYLQVLASARPSQQPAYYPSGNSQNQEPGWNAGAEATADLQAEESWNYAAPYTPYYGGGAYWGTYPAMRGYGGYGYGVRAGGYRR